MKTIKAILTGQSRGLGAALANELLARGVAVLGLSRKVNPNLVSTQAAPIEQVELDLADVGKLMQWLGGPSLASFVRGADSLLLINNAGTVHPVGRLDAQAPADIAQAINLNITAPLALAAAVAASDARVEDRRILHISSGAGRKSTPGWSVYCATKAALDHHARTVAVDHNRSLRISSMAPGVVDTDMQVAIRGSDLNAFPQRARFEALKSSGSLATPEATARKIVDYLLSDAFGSEPVTDVRELALG